MYEPAATPYLPEGFVPDSAQRRHFRALARSAPWLSTSLSLCLELPREYARPELGLLGELHILLRAREAIAIWDAQQQLLFQRETFTADRGMDYVAASASSWQLPASLVSPVFSDEHLVRRRPAIQGFAGLLPLPFLEAILDPFELAGEEPASLELAFSHPTYIHELRQITDTRGREVLQAVLSAGHSYQASVAGFELIPPQSRVLIGLDRATGVIVERTVLDGPAQPQIQVQVLSHNEYYIDSLFTSPAPTLVDVRKPHPWTLRANRGTGPGDAQPPA